MEREDQATVLMVDDDERLVASVRRVLAYEGYRVLTAGNATEGLQIARDESPDLVILDVMLPGPVDGLEFARRIEAGGGLPILMLSALDGIEDKVAGLEAGADDYLVKPFAVEELLARVRARLRRREPESGVSGAPAVLRFADLALDTGAREACRGDRVIRLTSKEYDLLHLFMKHPRRVLPHTYILEQVWGYDFEGESNLVPVYVGQLRQKLEADGEPRLIHTVRHAGYVLRE